MPIKKAAGVAGTGLKLAAKVVLYSILSIIGLLLYFLFAPAGTLKVVVLGSVVFFGGRYLLRRYKAKEAAEAKEVK